MNYNADAEEYLTGTIFCHIHRFLKTYQGGDQSESAHQWAENSEVHLRILITIVICIACQKHSLVQDKVRNQTQLEWLRVFLALLSR
jgi:hypothetical protein